MRRFFIWSALAAVIGLALAGGAYWAYWTYYAQFQPVTVTRNQADFEATGVALLNPWQQG